MANFKTIVVAVDFSPVSAAALRMALGLAKQLGSQIRIVHALGIRLLALIFGRIGPDTFERL